MRTLTYSLLLVVLVATVGLGWLFDQLYDQYNTAEYSKKTDAINVLEQLGVELAATLNDMENRAEFVQQWQERKSALTPSTLDANPLGYVLQLLPMEDIPLPKALLKEIQQGNPLLLETNDSLAFYFYLPKRAELLILKSPMLIMSKNEKSMNYVFTLLFYLALVLLFIVWIYPLVRQLHQLRKAAKSFGQGQLHQRISHSSLPYIRDIEVEFNHMAQRIEDLIADVKLLSSAVSHDLRTPLARIRFGIDTLQEEEDPILRRQFEQKISDNVDEMTSLVETLLTYSRLDQAMLELEHDQINLSYLINNSIALSKTGSTEITFYHSKYDVYINADQRYLAMMVNNLIANAIRYGKGIVSVDLHVEHEVIKLVIEDNGPGVSTAQQEKIFLPFVRGSHNEVANTKGHGIGLAIVKRIVEWHRGTITVSHSHALSGAQFTIELPKN
jgi:two-component system OmpR family sensor kinase